VFRRSRHACEHVLADIQTGETKYDYRGDEEREHSPSAPFHWVMFAIANCFLSQVFRPGPGEHSDSANDEKPMIMPDERGAAAKTDCHQEQWPNTTSRRQKAPTKFLRFLPS
jgi:hypothetical protein